MPSPARRFAVVIAFVLATASGVAFGAPVFYNNLLRRGIAEFNAGRNAGAVTLLRTAAFGLLDVIDQFEIAQTYIAVASQRLGREDDARNATRRIMAAERVQRRFASLPLPPDLREEFDAVAKRYLTVTEQTALSDPAAAVPSRPPVETSVRRRSTTPVQPAAPEASPTAIPPPARIPPAPQPAETRPAAPQATIVPDPPAAIVQPSPTPDAPAAVPETAVVEQQPVPVADSAPEAPASVAQPQPEEPSKIVEEVPAQPVETTPDPAPVPSRAEPPAAATPEPAALPEETPAPEPVVVVPEETPAPEPVVVVPEETPAPEPVVVVPEETPAPAVEQPEPEPEPPAAQPEVAKRVEPAPVTPAPAIQPTPTPTVNLPDEPTNEQPSTTPDTPAAQPEPAEHPRAADTTPASPSPAPDAVREAQREFERKVQEVERAAPEPPVQAVPLSDVTKSLQEATAALAKNDIFGARAMLRRILATEGLSRPDILRVAEESYRAGDFANATAAFARAGALRPGEEPFGYYLAVSLYETGSYQEAKVALREALPFIDLTDDVARYRAKIEGAVN